MRASYGQFKYPVFFKVTEGGHVALAFRKEVLINAQFFQTLPSGKHTLLSFKMIVEPAFDCRRADPTVAAKLRLGDTVAVVQATLSAKVFRAAFIGQNARHTGSEITTATPVLIFTNGQLDPAFTPPKAFMADHPLNAVLRSKLL
jgi:hypothetical protein